MVRQHSIKCIFLSLLLGAAIQLSALPPKGSSSKQTFSSKQKEGLIGVTEASPSDNPADNIFHVQIDQAFCGEENVWLEYELEGVEDHTSVSRSINDHRSVGGHLVKKRRGWAMQSERIDGTWLQQGDNVIRFTLPEGAQHSYRIRNLKITVGASDESCEQIIINQPSSNYYDKRAYVKGFLPENNRENIQLKIDGKYVPVFKGEFESEINFEGTDCHVEMELVYPDGTTQCKTLTYGKMESADYHYAISSTVYYKEQFINPSKADSVTLQGAGLKLLPNALSNSSFLSITTLRDVDIPALDAGMVNVTANHYGYRFLPHGTQFLKETKLRIPFDATRIPDGYTDKDIKTYFFDEQTHHWIAVNTDTLLANTSEIISSTTHFTDYINAIIKVPESPEAEAYNSTSMKGIKAANPTAAVNLISPPQANNTGSASLSYPINIPAGRNGMQPQLAISYNSAGGNGWLGLGWNLTIPSIGIDTRWGVPRYDPVKETETYTMNGEMLTPVAHRGILADRNKSKDKRFYPRVEGAFHKIIRHGNDPSSYWWEVTDKSGTRYLYGGTSIGNKLEKESVLRTDETNDGGNVAHWALSEVIDLNGNFVKYHYAAKVPNTGLANGNVKGYQLYIDNITYTGHNGSEGSYKIIFTREQGRDDVIISGNLGFKEVTADRLKKIEVKLGNGSDNIRSYVLNYKTGAFYKSLLQNIQEFDAGGKLFNTHDFDYYDDVDFKHGYKPFKDKSDQWQVGNDGKIRGDFLKRIEDTFDDNASMLSGTKSTDNSLGMAVNVGFNPRVVDKTFSVGGSFSSASSQSESLLTMIDLNGDGLPDKVFMQGGTLHYRPNLSVSSGEMKFGDAKEIKYNTGQPVTGFFKEKSKTKSGGLEAHGPAAAPVFGGYSYSKTKSEQSIYFTEVNGDQLPDLVNNGKVYFTRLNPETGVPELVESSGLTPSPIFQENNVAAGLAETDQDELQKAIKENPLHDVVKMWEAPYAGRIKVTAPVQLIEIHDDDRDEIQADGVRVAIQLNNTEQWSTTIGPDDYSVHTPTAVSDLTVNKGDRLYFRVGSVFNGDYDQVSWAPVVEYLALPFSLKKDVNSQSYISYDSKKDFKLSAPQKVSPPEKGRVTLESHFTKTITTDDVQLEIIRETTNPDDATNPDKVIAIDTLLLKKYSWKSKAEKDTVFEFDVDKGQYFYFRVHTNTNVNWAGVDWKPRMYYTALSDPKFKDQDIVDANGNPIIQFFPVADYSMHNREMKMSLPNKVWGNKDSVKVQVKPVLNIVKTFENLLYPFSGEIYFSVKKRNTLLYKDTIVIINNDIPSSLNTKTLKVLKNDSLFIEFHVPRIIGANADPKSPIVLADFINISQAILTVNDTVKIVEAGLHTVIDQKMIFGPMYHHWGHFAYQANGDRATSPLVQSDLKLDEDALKNTPKRDPNDFQDGNDLQDGNTHKPYDDKFIILVPIGKQQFWIGYDNDTYVSATGITSSRMGDNDPKATATTAQPGSGAHAISKMTESTSNSFSLGASAGVAGASATKSFGNSKVVSDFMDFNGDHYPDVVVGNRVQFTDARGGLSDKVFTPPDSYNMHSTNDATGFSLSGSFTTSKSQGGLSTNVKKPVVSIGDGKSSAGISANKGSGNSYTDFSWTDINGDGLPDKVSKNGVRLNLGYSFADEEAWDHGAVQNGVSTNEGAGLGISLWNGSISGGISLARSDNESTSSLQDVNGDGLVDLLLYADGQPLQVRFNKGNSFASPITWKGAYHIDESSSTSQSANVAFTAGIYFPPPLNIKITVNPSASLGFGASRELSKLSDMNGDGFPDYVTSKKYDHLDVTLSTIGRTNMLRSVQRPLGASFTMAYHRMGNTYDLPHNVWVLDSVKVFDGFKGDGADETLTTFSYEKGIFNRNERESYGFAKVITQTHDTQNNNLVYTTVTQTYGNNNYYDKGLLLNETMTDGLGRKYVVKSNRYDLKDIKDGSTISQMSLSSDDGSGNAFPALFNTIQEFFEGQPNAGKTTSMQYEYDSLGNVVTYTDNGDVDAEDDLKATIAYHYVAGKYIAGTPKSILVKNGGTTLRKRESVIDQNTGEVTQIKQYLDDKNIAVHDMQYDSYGNLVKMIRPANSTGQRLAIDYVYDGTVFTYPIQVSNSYGYSSSAKYDFNFGEKISTTDLNGNIIKYTLDDLGRVASIIGPYENGGGSTSNYTIKFKYHLDSAGAPAWALTSHFDPQNPKNDLQTSIFVDGLGRVLQTKKDVAIYQGDGKADTEVMSVSGRVLYDAFGRTTTAYYPTTEATGSQGEFNKNFDSVTPTTTTYDVMNRTLLVTLPDGAVTKTEYGFDNDRDGKSQFSTKTTDPNGKQIEQFTDIRGRVTSEKNYTSSTSVWTSFKYNALNEQIEATDDMKHTTFSTYDNFGRRTIRKHPDAGITTYSYDLAGNLQQLVTANLAAVGMSINYTYEFERLTQITYPQNPENNVKYTYGVAGEKDNRVGRMVLQEDATGAQEFFYGPLGEVVKNVRTVIIPQHDEQTFVTQWSYDTWNRLTSMVYPDGETVTYNYNLGGLLHDMSGSKKSANFSYVNQLGYDKFEQRVFLAYGNGTKTTYSYESDRRRLKNMTAQTSTQRSFMDNVYTYDKVNNILDLTNKAPVPSSSLMGGPSEYKYSYDDLYRLTNASGNYKGANDEESYSLTMSYNSVGGILTKNQNHLKKGVTEKKTTYNDSYSYGDAQPHAPIHIGKQTFTYDANGNQLGWKDDVSGQRRNIIWDEENRIRGIEDNGSFHHYVYDASGERVLKGQSSGQRIFVNGQWKAGGGQMGNFTVYVNSYIVLKSGGYTKHFYIEGQRIVSKLGGGWDNNGQGPLKTAGNGKVDYNSKTQQLSDGIVKNLKFLGADGQILTAGKSGKVPPGQVNGTGNIAEAFRYFYHPDHLGSTSYVTDASGEVYQHLEYFAFGETFVDEHSNTNRTPYLFNGKELDEETGLYYYGARYYDGKISVWTAVDPKSENYPSVSPYNYTFNNPIRMVDPDGKAPADITILGANNSSITVKTDLIDVKVDASSLGVDFGGNYSLNGREVLSAGLDIVGIFDPTGISDAIGAKMAYDEGDYFSAAISSVGVIPYLGDVAKVGKIGKDIKIIENAIDAVQDAKKIKSLRQSAVKKAWKQEKALVESGAEGTRNWTKAELKELKATGKVKDYKGHHIRNVKHHPKQAGNPNNIEFVTKKEHLQRHNGNYRNKTTGKLKNRSID